ncbi:MAG TPA: FapA family protein, partial [Burkholderiales bacterium]|nr:FapA family protein [Burkholderiales bacterium]
MERESSRPSEFGSSAFIIKNEKGVFVDLSKLESPSQFMLFADRVFSSGYHFTDLDYRAFLELLSEPEKIPQPSLRVASDIQIFPPERLGLYRQPKIFSGNAEYFFEPIQIEKVVEEPVFAENEAGGTEVVRYETRIMIEKISLTFDEFVASMWMKNIRYGIDADAVNEMISSGRPGRLVFAHPLPPHEGQDSSLKEQSDRLYRDNSPKELPNGKIDLRQFRNRFPQIRKGEKLLKKCPRVLGAPGMDITGKPIDPPLPMDFDLEALAGEGTYVERTPDGEFIVAGMDGFLNLDTSTNRIAVTERIVNYGGVSMKTTGDLMLDGEHFEEHGDIQEKRVVEGKSITVFGDVFGTVLSAGGRIHFKKSLVGGSAVNEDGDIIVEGLASSSL